MAKPALINYYARVLQKGQIKESDIPEEDLPDVLEKLKELPPLKLD